MSLKKILSDIHALANPERAKISQKFFKTGKGEYGEWDIFLGLTMPQTREVVKKHATQAPLSRGVAWNAGGLSLEDVDELLQNKHHEIRMAGVLLLVHFAQKKIYPLEEIATCYMGNAGFKAPLSRGESKGGLIRKQSNKLIQENPLVFDHPPWQGDSRTGVNNWDLIDVSSEHIIGPYIQECLTHEERVKFIDECIASQSIWVNRIIVLASFHQIKQGNEKLIFYIAERMLEHKHDLLHKAVGWMLREAGKRCSLDALRGFLDTNASKMPRTMLRYAIEKMDQKEREFFLKKKYISLS